MALFGLPDNGVSSGDDGSSMAFLTPAAAQAMRYDPRSLLVQSMMGTAQNQLNQPTPTTGAAIAKALTMGMSGLSSAYLEKQYADAAKGAPAEIGAALSSSDPLTALTQSKNPVARMMGFQLAPQVLSKRLTPVVLGEGQQQFMPGSSTPMTSNTAPLSPQGKLAHDVGSANPLQTAADLKRAETDATNQSDLKYKPEIAGKSKLAEAPGTIAAAVGTAQGTAPVEMFKELYKPQVNRVTGAITIPGIDNPQVVKSIMDRFQVTPQMMLSGGPAPSAPVAPPAIPAAPQPSSPAASANGGAQPPAPSPNIVAPAQPAAAQSVPSQPAAPKQEPPKGPVPVGTMNPIDEIPKVPLPTGEMPITPGTISPGRDPIAIKAGEEAVQQAGKQYEETADTAKASVAMKGQLGTMRSLIDQGKLITNAIGPVREEIAGILYAASGGNVSLARSITGIDPTAADVFNKESTRLGFSLARTLGAREAAQIIQGAIKANPNLAATTEGNKMVIDLLSQAAQHDIDAQRYADAWLSKSGHYVGAQGWFNENHPVQEYTSKVIPYQLPRLADGGVDASKLEPNVTYNIQSKSHGGPAIWNGHGFIPVKQ